MGENTRRSRIKGLVSWAKDGGLTPTSNGLYDKLFNEARRRYPTLTKKTLESYAHSSLFIMRKEKVILNG